MVKILPSGEIVQDDDPRLNTTNSQRNADLSRRRGFIQGDEHRDMEPQQQGGDGLHGQPVAREGEEGRSTMSTVFDSLNNRLLTAGFPRFNIGPYPIEPIVAAGTILAGLLIGLPGLIFAALLFAIVKWSDSGGNMSNFTTGRTATTTTNNSTPGGSRNDPPPPPKKPRGGSGQKLGRS